MVNNSRYPIDNATVNRIFSIMIVTRGIDIRLYPNKGQANFINKMVGATRVVYNTVLYKKQKHWKEHKENLKIKPTDLYSEYEWLKELDSQGICNAYNDLMNSYNNWFSNLAKKNNSKAKAPKYKKKSNVGSYRNAMCQKAVSKLFRNGKIFLPKMKLVTYKANIETNRIKKIYNVTIKKTNTNKYFCSICCDYEIDEYEHTGECVGLDLGIKDLIITSNGEKFDNKKFIKNSEKQIKHLQREYSRKTKGSKNQEKARLKLAIAHEKLSNKRKDYLHKLTTKLVKENDIICIEDLNIKGMMKNHKLAKAIQACSFSMIRSMLTYKCSWHNRQLVVIDRWSPSSKTCNCCGHIMKNWNLSIREWTCPNCNTHHDRDINAARNILDEGLRILDTVGTTDCVCGGDSLVLFESRSSMKQENRKSATVEENQLSLAVD